MAATTGLPPLAPAPVPSPAPARASVPVSAPSLASLGVIGLISGGKDSFFGLLHCLAQGHRIVALANLYPEDDCSDNDPATDLNSFMYQTVGHQVIPLYATATHLPLFREPITGRAVQHGRDYEPAVSGDTSSSADETESMTVLLRRVCAAHPEANAVCAGAVLSTYQRTRVESVAERLGLTALAFLWQYPLLSFDSSLLPTDPPYLVHLAAAGFDARIVKVASAGLDDRMLWTDVASLTGRARLHRALSRFGGDPTMDGSMLGEGGEYETLVMAGPPALFPAGTLAVEAADRSQVVHEGGGSAWLHIRAVSLQPRADDGSSKTQSQPLVCQPLLLDRRFSDLVNAATTRVETDRNVLLSTPETSLQLVDARPTHLATWCIVPQLPLASSIADAMQSIADQVRHRLHVDNHDAGHPSRHIARTLVVLRRMADFPAVNRVYGALFTGASNPPARVTIACGDLMQQQLPPACDVAVFFSVLSSSDDSRQGLHVQSRSYWAPANIGPYSQAVSLPLARLAAGPKGSGATSSNAYGPRIVSVAGQIPLVPATMTLPDHVTEARARQKLPQMFNCTDDDSKSTERQRPASFAFQAALAVQHLWRIGRATDVQWWSSAVVYVPRQSVAAGDGDGNIDNNATLSEKAVVAARIWEAAHLWKSKNGTSSNDDDDYDDDSGPDLWDRTFNARYTVFGGGGGDDAEYALPDWSVLDWQNGRRVRTADAIPPVFLAEVHSLPRDAPVEWHAQAGFSHLPPCSVRVVAAGQTRGGATGPTDHYTVLPTTMPSADNDEDEDNQLPHASTRVVQAVRAWPFPPSSNAASVDYAMLTAYPSGNQALPPDVVYADPSACWLPSVSAADAAPVIPVVPCASLWNGHGERLAAVIVWTALATEEIEA